MKVAVCARIRAELAEQVRRMAADGNRTVSREVAEAIRRHVMIEQFSSRPPAGAAGVPPPHSGPTVVER
jgi:hypothetical protein